MRRHSDTLRADACYMSARSELPRVAWQGTSAPAAVLRRFGWTEKCQFTIAIRPFTTLEALMDTDN